MKVEGLDHLVLTIANIEQSASFYQNVLGMQVITFAEGRVALRFRQQKINLHQTGAELEPKALKSSPGSADLCFLTETDLHEVQKHREKRHHMAKNI